MAKHPPLFYGSTLIASMYPFRTLRRSVAALAGQSHCNLEERRERQRLRQWLRLGAALPVLGFSVGAHAADYYVAPDGNNSNAGTQDKPFATMARGQQAAVAGDTVYLRGGTYKFTSGSDANGVSLNKSGSSGKPIKYWAYEKEIPIFDFSGMTAALRITGIRVTASWIHLKGIELKLVPQNITDQNESWGVYNDNGDNNVYEQLNLHHNMGPGFFLGGGANNLILNCDSHHNYDPKSKAGQGENADGFGCHPKAGDTGNVYRGIRAWWNTDDGFDSISALAGCTVEGSWAWLNGYLPDTMQEPMRKPEVPPGNGNGFKLGGFGIDGSGSPASPPVHKVINSVAFLNVFAGFFANYHTGGNTYYNNTGFKNGADFDMLGLNMVNKSLLRNNLALGPTPTKNMNGTDAKNNSWNLAVEVTDADFQSVSTVGVDGPRQPDGSLPNIPLVRLMAGSDLIDKGVDIGKPFRGAAPDLGAYELGEPVGTGGSAGAGGAGGGGGGGVAGAGGSAGAAGSSGGSGSTVTGGNGGASAGAAGSPSEAGRGGTGAASGGGASAGGSGGSAAPGSAGSSNGSPTGGAAPVASGGANGAGTAPATSGGSGDDAESGCALTPGTKTPAGAFVALGLALSLLALRRHRRA